MPSIYKNSIEYIRATNPGFEVRVVDSTIARDTLKSISPDLDSVFDDILIPAVKSDIMRMAILHKFGGWYIDCDSRPRIGVDFWADSSTELVLNWVDVGGKVSLQNSFLGGKREHDFFVRALTLMGKIIPRRMAHYNVYRSSGPEICLLAATPYVKDSRTNFSEMDYKFIDVIMGHTKGSWTFQECCGIWGNEQNPVKFNGNVPIGRIESLDAFNFFKKTFAKFPKTENENMRNLMVRAGAHYVYKHKISEEVCDLFVKYVPVSMSDAYKKLQEKLKEIGSQNGYERISKHISGN